MIYICFDIGGTFIKYGIVDENGNILQSNKTPTPKENCAVEIPNCLIKIIQDLQNKEAIQAIGISSAGQINSKTGTVIFAMDTIPNYTGCELKKEIENKVNIPVFVENDANCAALGEMWMGAGKDKSNFVCMTLGTGVGGAIIINRKLYTGLYDAAGDVGKILLTSNILESPNNFDYLGSTKSLLKRYEILTGDVVDGFGIADKIRENDEFALKAYDDFLSSLIAGLQTVSYMLAPEAIIVGGGISAEGDFFFNKVNDLFKSSMIGFQKNTKIIKAELENSAGLLGAAYICIH